MRGLVVFHDAWLVPPLRGEEFLAPDVLTVHQKTYYDREGVAGRATDHEDPNPVSFLSVPPGRRILVAASGPALWTELALMLLREALVEWGIGAKNVLTLRDALLSKLC